MELPQEVPTAALVDDFANGILDTVTGLRPPHTAIDRGLDIRRQQYLAVLGFGRCCGRLEVCQFPGVYVRDHLRHDHVPAIGEVHPRHRCRQKPSSLERVREPVFAAANHGGYPIDIEVEDTGMPVSEGARHRRFPYAGRPVQVYESYHLAQATYASPILLIPVVEGALAGAIACIAGGPDPA
jgi:hypothetical protein